MVVLDEKRVVQCTLVGDKTTGKTSLARFSCKHLRRTEDSTVFDTYAATVSAKRNETNTVGIFDCSSQNEHKDLRHFAYKDSDVFVLCYSATDRKSFQNIKDLWIPEIQSFLGHKFPIVLVATHADKRNSLNFDEDIPVSEEEGLELAKEIQAEAFVDSSANNKNCGHEVFQHVLLSAQKNKKRKNIIHRILRK